MGVLIDGPWEHNAEITRTFEQEILELTGREFEVVLPSAKQITGDWTVGSLSRGLDQLLSDPDVDVIITAGVLGSNEAGHRGAFSKPVIAPFVINAGLQNIPLVDGTSGVKNFAYVAFPSNIVHNIRIFQSVVSFSRMAYLYTPPVIEAIPELIPNLTRAISELDLKIDFVPIQGDVDQAVRAIPDSKYGKGMRYGVRADDQKTYWADDFEVEASDASAPEGAAQPRTGGAPPAGGDEFSDGNEFSDDSPDDNGSGDKLRNHQRYG